MKKIIYLLSFFICYLASSQNETISALLKKSDFFYKKEIYDSAYTYAKRGLVVSQKTQNDSFIIKSCITLLFSTDKVMTEEQYDYFKLAESKAISIQNWKLLTDLYYTKGHILFNKKEMAPATLLFLKVDSIATTYNFKNETIVKAILDRSEISRRQFSYETTEIANDLQQQAMKIAKEIKSDAMINDIYLRMADMKGLMGEYPNAKRYTDSAFVYYKKVDDITKVYLAYQTYTNYYYAVNQIDSAKYTLEASIAYLHKKDRPERLGRAYVSYGTFFRKHKDNCAKAIIQYEKAKSIFDTIEYDKVNRRYMYLMDGMGICYATVGDYKKSSVFYKEAYEVKKTLVKKSNKDLTRNLETKYQSEKKAQEIVLLTTKNQLFEVEKRNQRNLLLTGLGVTTIAGVFFFFLYRNRQKTNQKLKELDTAKSTFFANISHEFRTPLTLIKGPVEDQLETGSLTAAQRKNLRVAKSNTQRLESLVDQLLALSKLESGNLKLQIQPGNLGQFISVQADAFSFITQEKGIAFRLDITEDTHLHWFDHDALEKVVFNLLGNAVKYTPQGGEISFYGARNGNYFEFSVINSGNYLSSDEQKNIFKRFYQTDSQNPGTGIGLALTKELIELHHGSIVVDSVSKGETKFSVRLPIKKESYTASEILSEVLQNIETKSASTPSNTIQNTISETQEFIETATSISEDTPILLIVDDHAAIRDYIGSLFENAYRIYKASNGIEGFEKAQQLIPDIIISDVMMPGEDGFNLTSKIKTTEVTTHIPVLLLTANTEDTLKIKGLETGADAYLTKPFNSIHLKATVANLIENRRKLQQRFAQEVILTPKEISVSSADELFLERLQKTMDEYITNSQFSIEAFSREMSVSRMQLHRKLKALTGQSTSEFLRTQRLKLAANLLKEGKILVSEVGYVVGFNDPSYFGKSFKKEFGCTPSEYSPK